MLKLKYLYENYELVKLALKSWEYDTETLGDCLQHFRISSNAVYPFLWQGNMRFLRLSPASEKMENNLKGELEFLCYLQSRSYPAAIPVASNSGELVVTLDSIWGKYYASVFKGVAGISIEDTDRNEHIVYVYGKALGQLHMLSAEYSPEIRKWTYRDVLIWIRKTLEKYNAPNKMMVELAEVQQALDLLPRTSDSFGLVHYDFEPDNVFWDETRQCCTAIDFEDGMYHFFLLDLEQALEALLENIPDDRKLNAKTIFLRGYQSVKMLEPDYAEKLKLMRRFCNLYSYARLIRCIDEEYPNEPDWMVRLREKLQRKIVFLESSVTG
ncbi:MAG: phosphotransferase [Lachnospiraceae bacterium]|nr:phosphotransferase [Lachnospiraceae bacterium]